MNITDRHQIILQKLQENGKVDIQALSDQLQVSGVTIRKDLKLLEDISCGLLFLGVDGIEPEFGLSITNLAEASLDKKMIQVSQKVVVLADSTKFGRRGIGRICGLEQVHYIITDTDAPPETIKQIEEKGVKVIIAE